MALVLPFTTLPSVLRRCCLPTLNLTKKLDGPLRQGWSIGVAGDASLEGAFRNELALARRVRAQQQRQVGPKVYSLHAPEVECIGKGKPHKPYEFSCKWRWPSPTRALRGASS